MITRRLPEDGFTLLEIMVVLGLMSAIALIALPHYQLYVAQGKAAACQANRRHIEMDERGIYLESNQVSLAIDPKYRCPAGGTYVWLVSDPAASGYPQVVCSLHGPATTPPAEPGAEALFSSSFDSMDGLTPLRGKWLIKDDALVNAGGDEHRLAFGDTGWTDYTTTVRATLDKGSGYGIYYRADGEEDITGYCFQYDPGYGAGEFLVRKVVDGRETAPIQRVRMPDGYPVYDQSHEISIAVSGDRHVITIDGEPVMDFADASFSSGAAGLRTWSSAARFESVAVTPAER